MAQFHSTFATDMAYLATQSRVPASAALAVRVAVTLSKWATIRRTRMALSRLPDHLLQDVGLTRAEAKTEAERVFWRM
ncbi:MAG: DUF1127 domain-containing protein [Pseudomonadota bacterium]